jgi:hypothetical protein
MNAIPMLAARMVSLLLRAAEPFGVACAAVVGLVIGMATTTTAMGQGAPGTRPITGISMTSSDSAEGQVTAINQGTRMVTLALTDGRTVSGKVSEIVQNLAQVKIGDRVAIAYEEKLSFVLSGPNAATPSDRMAVAAVGAGPGQKPSGGVASTAVVSWLVVSTNVAANKISLVNPNGGQIRTFDVLTPEGRAELPRVKPGDRLTVISTEIVVGAVTPKS